MATFTARVTIAPLDRQLLVATVPAVLRRLRELSFGDDGSLVHDGRRIEGLRVDRGVHPRVGTRYTAVFTPPPDQLAPPILPTPDHAMPDHVTPGHVTPGQVVPGQLAPGQFAPGEPVPEMVRYELVADDARQTVLRTETGSPVTTVLVTLQNPADPTELRCDFGSALADGIRWLDGPITGVGTMALDRFPPASSREPQVTAAVQHHRARGGISARVDEQPDGTWLVTVQLELHGRGLLRPVVGIAARIYLRSRWQEWVNELPAMVTKFQQELPPGGPEELAGKLVDELIDDLVPELPSGTRT